MSAQAIVCALLFAFFLAGLFVGHWRRQDEIDGLRRDVRNLAHVLRQTEEIVRVQERLLVGRGVDRHPVGRHLRVVEDA